MPEQHLFEYAVIRVVPRVEREEFMNVGVIIFSQRLKYLQCKFSIDATRLTALCRDLCLEDVTANLQAFERICHGSIGSGPIGRLDLASRFRWLTATRSTIVQASKVHPGFCVDADSTLERLFEQQVL
jgi:hypothetical protein